MRDLKKMGWLQFGCGVTRTLQWMSLLGTSGFAVRVYGSCLELEYGFQSFNGRVEHVKERVRLVATASHFGGARRWIECPECKRRVVAVYGVGRHFRCRHCHELTYNTAQEAKYFRPLRKAQKMRKRLGGSKSLLEPFPTKPPGMHWATYERLFFGSIASERSCFDEEARRLGLTD